MHMAARLPDLSDVALCLALSCADGPILKGHRDGS
jgi:hypothetical protein